MKLAGLLAAALVEPTLARAVEFAAVHSGPGAGAHRAARDVDQVDLLAPAALRPLLVAAVAAESARGGADRPVLAVTATTREADDLAAELGALLPPECVAVYPAWETLPHERLSPRSDTVGRRLAVLRRLAHPDEGVPIQVLVAPIRSLLQPQLKGLGDIVPIELSQGGSAELEAIVRRLADMAYTRTDLVAKRGEFAVRGGILDVFPPTQEHPLRVEFFGDEVEEIRSFSVADQRTLSKVDKLWAPPCRELLLTPAVRQRAAELAAAHPALAEMLEKLAEGIPVEGMESLAPALLDGADCLELILHCVPAGTLVLQCDPERIRTRAHDLVRTSDEFLQASWAAAASGGKAPIDLGSAAFRSLAQVRAVATELGLGWWSLSPFGLAEVEPTSGSARPAKSQSNSADDPAPWLDPQPTSTVAPDLGRTLAIAATAARLYHGDTGALVDDLKQLIADSERVVLVFGAHGPAKRAVEVLREAGLGVRMVESLPQPPAPGEIVVTTGAFGNGLRLAGAGLTILTGADISGGRGAATRDLGKMPSRRRNTIDPLELRMGDYVVHEQHGIGRYVELVQRKVNGADREYLVIEYGASKRGQPGDRLFVPTDSLDQLSRYVGGEAPSLHKLGGSDWQKSKARARKAVREIAASLIQLYAARQSARGFAFGPDSPWQRELEDAFPYIETPDQLAAIDEVKVDMEKPVPMDRLICGDVGYGKTEIAVRAAFKAVQDGKQVAVLVPTTLLAQQHFNTFSERMSQFPMQIRQLSRFQTAKESELTLAGIAEGSVDIAIGTHRLLQASTRFKSLGLLIVDEEQRFGVEHKEFLKNLRTQVDVLTMSATPIPRTLEMAITGIREMSTIATPPEERHPVLTFVGAQDERQIAAAIHRELLRDGQIFYLHNRVESIDKAARRLREIVPEARVAVAHGQMGEDALEKVMVGFWEKQFDVLVCTTIVESGIDIPNANTLIVERADLLGLAQLHQIRGRVGRSRERAYAYFLYPADKPLSEHAHERLATIAAHTELGAGMYVAMKDLEIRGAGNLLGGEQSGHIEGVGFDLYIRMVGEAVQQFKGEEPEEVVDVKIDLPIDAHLPLDYIGSERLRLEMYRKLAEAKTPQRLEEIEAELRDRYGAPPTEVLSLLAVARFRLLVRSLGLAEVSIQGRNLKLGPLSLPDSRQLRLRRFYPDAVYKPTAEQISLPQPMTKRVGGEPLRDLALLAWCEDLLRTVADPAPPATTVPAGSAAAGARN